MSLETKMTRNGIVVSNKADKTVVVKVERKFQHPLYHRTVKQTAKFMAHDVGTFTSMDRLTSNCSVVKGEGLPVVVGVEIFARIQMHRQGHATMPLAAVGQVVFPEILGATQGIRCRPVTEIRRAGLVERWLGWRALNLKR